MGKKAMAELDAEMKTFTDDAISIKLSSKWMSLYDFGEKDEKGEGKDDFKKIIADNWTEPSRREQKQKRNYAESDYFNQKMRVGPAPKPRETIRVSQMPQLHNFHFG